MLLWSMFTPPPTPSMSTLSTLPSIPTELWTFYFIFSESSLCCLLGVGPVLEHSWPIRPLKKSNFSCLRRSSVLVAPQLGWDPVPTSPPLHSPHRGFLQLELAQLLCICPVVCGKHLFLTAISHFWLLHSFSPSLAKTPESSEGRVHSV